MAAYQREGKIIRNVKGVCSFVCQYLHAVLFINPLPPTGGFMGGNLTF